MKGETIDEITGAASVMRSLPTPVTISHPHLADTCGTGEMAPTCSMSAPPLHFEVAAAGVRLPNMAIAVSAAALAGADVLEAAGVNLQLNARQVA